MKHPELCPCKRCKRLRAEASADLIQFDDTLSTVFLLLGSSFLMLEISIQKVYLSFNYPR